MTKSKRLCITWAIEQFLDDYCFVTDYGIDIAEDACLIKYEDITYLVPDDIIMIDENDDLLKTMLIATFKIE